MHLNTVTRPGAGEIQGSPGAVGDKRNGIFLLLQYAPGGDLFGFLGKTNGVDIAAFPWKDRIRSAIDIAEGMNFLHAQNPPLIHRDLKSNNILRDREGRWMIADFGLTRPAVGTRINNTSAFGKQAQQRVIPAQHTKTKMTRGQGTVNYMAPEVLNEQYGAKADVYSFAIVMWELTTCRTPWKGKDHIILAVNKGERPVVTDAELEHAPPRFVRLMKRCWDTEPTLRPSFDEALQELRSMDAELTSAAAVTAGWAEKTRDGGGAGETKRGRATPGDVV
jgi:serine/threonine protein kinase